MDFQFLLLLGVAASLPSAGSWWANPPPLPSPTAYTGYQLNAVCQPSSAILTPSSVEALVSIVQNALAANSTVKALGARHSNTDIICTGGTPIDMRSFQGMSYNAVDQTGTFGSGASVRSVCEFLEGVGRGLRVIPAYGGITIGGALGTGAHGSSIRWNSSLSQHVVGVTIVDGLGQLRHLTEEEDLVAFRVHLGLLGIIVNVTLATVPLYKVRAHNYMEDDRVLADGTVSDWARRADQLYVYWFPSLARVVIANFTIVSPGVPGNAYSNALVPSNSASFSFYATALMEFAQALDSVPLLRIAEAYTINSVVGQNPDYVPVYTEDGVRVQNPATGVYHKMWGVDCSSMGWIQYPWLHGPFNITTVDNEMTFPLRHLPVFVKRAKEILAASPTAFPLQGIWIRFSGPSDALMSSAYGKEDVVHVEWMTMKRRDSYNTASTGLAGYQALMQTMAGEFGGKTHWGKSGLHWQSARVLASDNSMAKQKFTAKMREHDPHGVFLNDFGRRLMGTGTALNTDPLTRHCAILDGCLCATDADCAPGQVCITLSGWQVCKSATLPRFPILDWKIDKFLKFLPKIFANSRS